ncbi:ArnT family glycosyltransferase [Nannocystis pusilla]|uniref:ArnT family glycosyltransferase n=1 Tax=Nannocystis pusilla TaxID=889268 RepID=UPI003B7C7AAD
MIAFAAVLVAFARRWQVRCGPLACPESIALVAALTLGGLGLLAALLAVGGIFSAPSFSFTAIALAVLAWPWGQRAPRRRPARSLPRAAGLIALLLGAAALRWPPIPADLGGRDQGTYVLRARHTLRTGRTGHTDPVLARAGAEAELRPGPGDILGLYHADRSPARRGRYEGAYRPGFYLTRRDDGEVVPQFLHLHPSLLALFGLVFGPWSMGLVAPLAGVLSALALWALGERLWPRAGASWLAAGLFALSPIAVWTARTPLTESLTGLLLLAAALAVARGLAPTAEGAARTQDAGATNSTARTPVHGTGRRSPATAGIDADARDPDPSQGRLHTDSAADASAHGPALLASADPGDRTSQIGAAGSTARDLSTRQVDSTARGVVDPRSASVSASHLGDPAHGHELTAALLLGLAGFVRGNLWLSAPALLAVLWLRTEPGLRRMSAPTLLLGLLLASLALHLATGYPYLHDEFKRQLGPVTALSPVGAVVLGLGAIAVYLALDAALDLVRGRVRRLPLVLAGLGALAALTWWLRWAPVRRGAASTRPCRCSAPRCCSPPASASSPSPACARPRAPPTSGCSRSPPSPSLPWPSTPSATCRRSASTTTAATSSPSCCRPPACWPPALWSMSIVSCPNAQVLDDMPDGSASSSASACWSPRRCRICGPRPPACRSSPAPSA